MKPPPARPSPFALWISGLLFLGLLPLYVRSLATSFPIDFTVFWCSGKAWLDGRNPYLEGSLHGCEVAHGLIATLTMPALHPPYLFPIFAAFALLPAPLAFALWSALVAAGSLLAAVALGRLTALPVTLTVPAAAAIVLLPALPYGQVAPFAICGLAWALVAIRDDQPLFAAAALACAAILPNFAVPAWIAAFLFVPRTRVWIVVAAALLAGIGIVASGPTVAWTYVHGVLPAQARAELTGYWQVGIASIVHALGVSASATPAVADVLFAVAIAAGIACGLALRARYGGDEWVVAAAAAFGVAAAPYSHGHDVGFALPLALMLFAAVPSVWSAGAVVLVSTPWQILADNGGVVAAIVYPPLLLTIDSLANGRLRVTAVTLAAIFAVSFGLLELSSGNPPPSEIANRLGALPAPAPDAIATIRWTRLNDAIGYGPYAWYERAPIYAGFALLVFVALRSARKAPSR